MRRIAFASVRNAFALQPRLPQLRPRMFCSQDWKPKDIEESVFHSIANRTLDVVVNRLDEGDINLDGFDIEMAEGVMNILMGENGTWVLNKQTPNRQLWLSSPISGPARFDYETSSECWIHSRTGESLNDLLVKEFSEVCGIPITFTEKF